MTLNFRFAVVSDLHIALPHTVWSHPSRFHMVEVSIPALEIVFEHLEQQQLDFLLLPGDLTQDGEPDNHAWLQQRLAQLPFPVYVIPGNHDFETSIPGKQSITATDFPQYYRKFGYETAQELYYTQQVLPGLRLISLNSNHFNAQGKLVGRLDNDQLKWLHQILDQAEEDVVFVMVHHNVIEHIPHQSRHQLGQRYMLENAPELLQLLQDFGVQLVFTGHLHVQDVAQWQNIYEITTGSLVSYPHPYRIIQFHQDDSGQNWLKIESHRVEAVPDVPQLQQMSRQWIGDRSFPFMLHLLTQPPLNLPQIEAEKLAPHLRYFWADIAAGDALFEFPDLPVSAQRYFAKFGAIASDGKPLLIDNNTTLRL
ncbi:metallophosphoesterase family protein [Gloeocapsopsis dulcis]|uniref:Metallophosphoesterase n=1 Tax=Gloeocapsopsis dulcis AAB1 = 1H9 TaxID=1433147 RepID=A0A6N8FXP3_9CHRO|nr:metallophosphoesterase [Gloeocapsopsis dulcis]MUL37534.1 metallophosphoesterase [Gloeocapsopsis dulcis AAB1 = 1H9]WNN87948.1 metallophosphoesterase [Gloeocapsopsis dulcis]